MVPGRFIFIIVACALLLATTAGPAVAKKPEPGAERPLSAAEQTASDRKVAAAEAYVASVSQGEGTLASLACIAGPVEATTVGADAPASGLAAACAPPNAFLAMEARDQVLGTYCGPAVGQVIANYAWAAAAGKNVFLQPLIAQWMRTDQNGGTDAFNLEVGLETGTRGAPRRPGNWDWLVTAVVDRDADGTTADQLHDYARTNISQFRMPLALAVKPHDARSNFNLASWPRPVASPGHWIAIYGWLGLFTGNDDARLYYTDSSRDEGGATGKFWTPTRHIAAMVAEHTRRIVW